VATPLVVFTDARQRFAPGALAALVAPFADPAVGAVTGELRIEGGDGGVGLYWRLETQLRLAEARLGWLHGVSGSLWALRRTLFRPLPPGTILDDMWLPCHVALAGRRVWMTREAAALDNGSATADEEFVRKLRTLAGNWQLLDRVPVLLVPWRNPVFFAWCSHKFLRLLAPWGLLTALVASAFCHGAFYRFAFFAQLVAYGIAFAGLMLPRLAARVRVLGAASAFLLLNLAAFLSLPAALAWTPARLWRKH